jgi:hydrogenase nickel incorporation protein HypA/HybF
MHELAVCQALIGQVEQVARLHRARAITAITVAIGPLAGVEAPLLRQAYPLAAAGTRAEGAALIIETAPIRVRCETCGAETDATVNRLVCGQCGDWHTQVLSGDELVLASIELTASSE